MKIGILGTGVVGRTLGAALVAAGHEVRLGSRAPGHEGAAAWVGSTGPGASQGTFADAADHGEIVFLAVAGAHAARVLEAAAEPIRGKVLIDVCNPLDFSQGFPPRLSILNDDSLAETLQRAHPEARIVKALNTVSANVMVDPASLGSATDLLICGEDSGAKQRVAGLLREAFGWERIVDLGGLSHARGTEAWLLLWTRLYGALGTDRFNMRLVRDGE